MKVGIIGASFAKAAYLPAFRHVPGAEVVAIASARLDSARAAAEAFAVPHSYDDWRAMLDAHPLDLVCVATPTDTHAPMTLAAVAQGAAVLCEKPTAMNAGEARAMWEAAEARGVAHMIDHELRFNPNRRLVKRLIEAGEIGTVRHVTIQNVSPSWGDPASRAKGDWWSDAARGGGRLGANGSHQVDLLRFWLGEVLSVSATIRTAVPDRRDKTTGEPWTATADDLVQMNLEMAGGALATVLISAVARHALDSTTEIVGSEGTILLANATETVSVARAGESFRVVSEPDPNAALPGLNPGIWNVSVVGALRELAAAIAERRPVREGATFRDGWRNQLVLDAALRSSAERRTIDLPAS